MRRVLSFAAPFLLFSAPAAAADGGVSAPWLLSLLAVGAAVAAVSAYSVSARRLSKHGDLLIPLASAALTRESPEDALLVFRPDGGVTALGLGALLGLGSDETIDVAALCRSLETVDGANLGGAIDRLRADGVGFALDARGTEGENDRRFALVGRRVAIPVDREVDVVRVRDISDEFRLRHDAVVERDILRETLNALPFPIWCRDKELSIIDCNDAYVAAVEADSVAQVVAEGREIAAAAIENGGKALAHDARDMGTPLSQNQHVVIGGSRRLLEITEQPLTGTSMVLGLAIDHTGFEEASVELRRHVDAHGEVLQHMATAVAIYGPDKRLKFFNGAFVNLWGLDGEFLYAEPSMGEVLEALRVRRRLPEFADFLAWKREQERQFMTLIDPVEDLMHLSDGRTLRTLTTPHPFGGLLFLYEDVTDRLALERSYNTLIDVQRETLDHLYEGVAVVGGDGRIKLFNSSFARIWDLPESFLDSSPHFGEVVDRSRHFIETENWDSYKERVVARVTDRQVYSGELERTDDTVLNLAFVPLPDGGTLLSYIDSTDSSRVQRALRDKAEALETTDRLKTEFLTNVSYELRTPLNTIIGFSEILEKNFYGELNERQQEYVGGILQSSQGLLALIDNILDLSMIEAGRLSLEFGEIDLATMLGATLDLGTQWARQANSELDLDLAPDLGHIVGDERRLKQAVMNLVSNAVKFTGAGGRITISARRNGDQVAIGVTDTGMGIDAADQKKIFEKFERGRTPDGRAAGVGLGLSLVKQIVQLHGGRVEISSLPGEGSTVTCVLPDDPPRSATDESPTAIPAVG
ncbi:MAG: PAS domain-containing protein [Alphaproteobacteria bacterium]|nr:PAS domain-containing protein [Alphaproteobacteria bacterium]